MNISIQKNHLRYLPKVKTFLGSGKEISFSTKHTVTNEKTNENKVFHFKESTGSEWEQSTVWIYESTDGYKLHVDSSDVTPEHSERYLQSKLR